MSLVSKSINKLIRPLGYRVTFAATRPGASSGSRPKFPKDFTQDEIETCELVKPYTMTSRERVVSLIRAVKFVAEQGIPGAFVECGVWRGGSMMSVASTLLRLNATDRDLYLFDTFEGMSAPTGFDIKAHEGVAAAEKWHASQSATHNEWCYASLEDVRGAVLSVGYPPERIHFVKGKVEDTLPAAAPESIALLRLDTDFYESTRHEMVHLYPRLTPGGVFISDDYNTWQGARKAIDEYLREHHIPLLLSRMDSSGVIGIKP